MLLARSLEYYVVWLASVCSSLVPSSHSSHMSPYTETRQGSTLAE